MKWKKFRIKTKTEAEDIIISSLYDIGLEGAQIEDNVPLTALEKEQMFVDILPQIGEDDGTAYLSFFVEETEEGELLVNGEKTTEEQVLDMVNQELESLKEFLDIGEGTIVVDETEDIDWIDLSSFFQCGMSIKANKLGIRHLCDWRCCNELGMETFAQRS